MTEPHITDLRQATAGTEKWLRRCNGQPADGIPVTRADLLTVLAASTDVRIDERGVISWAAPRILTTRDRRFTAEPVRDDPSQMSA